MSNESDPIMINGKAVKTDSMEDGTHIVSPVFQEEHKLGRKRHDEYLRINIEIDNKKLLNRTKKIQGFGDMRHMSADDKFKGVITALGELMGSGTWKGRTPINPISTAGLQELRDRLNYSKISTRIRIKRYSQADTSTLQINVGVAPKDDITGEGKPRADRMERLLSKKNVAQFEQSPPELYFGEKITKNAKHHTTLD